LNFHKDTDKRWQAIFGTEIIGGFASLEQLLPLKLPTGLIYQSKPVETARHNAR
jgi:hypothetical protein